MSFPRRGGVSAAPLPREWLVRIVLLVSSAVLPVTSTFSTYAKSYAAGGGVVPYGAAPDSSGNLFTIGGFFGTSCTWGKYTLPNAGSDDIFVVKTNSTGGVTWAMRAGGTLSDVGLAVAVDSSGHAYFTGFYYSPTITWGSTTLTNAASSQADIFVVRINSTGAVAWAKSYGNTDFEQPYSIAVDSGSSLYVTGVFASSSLILGTKTLTNTFSTKYDGFLLKLSKPSGAFVAAASVCKVRAPITPFGWGWIPRTISFSPGIICRDRHDPDHDPNSDWIECWVGGQAGFLLQSPLGPEYPGHVRY
jgi:hypothetical protein